MSKEEYIIKILELSKEIMILTDPTIEELKKLYIQTKLSYEIIKETTEEINGEDNE